MHIEKAGTGTLDMIALCREAGLPEPDFRQDGGQFVMTLWRDWLTGEAVDELGLNERQKEGVRFLKKNSQMSNMEYQSLTKVLRKTAARDLSDLVAKGVLMRFGAGRGVYYVLNRKRDKSGTNGTSRST